MTSSYDIFTVKNGFVPELLGQEIVNTSTKTNRFIQSGILSPDNTLNSTLLTQSGEMIKIPFTNDLDGDPEPWTDEDDISVAGFTSGMQKIFRMRLAKAFGYTDVSELTTVNDPAGLVSQRFGAWWTRADQKILLALLKGVFSNPKVADAKLNDDSKNNFSPRGFLATIGKLGDLQDQTFNKIAVHSSVYQEMKAQNMLDLPGNNTPQNQSVTPFGTYNGMEIVVDDDLPLEGGVATSYIFGNGAVKYAIANPNNSVEVEREARLNGGRTNIINRRVETIHVNGTTVADGFTPKKQTVSIDELSQGSTWDVVTDPRNINVVAYKAKVSDEFLPADQKAKSK